MEYGKSSDVGIVRLENQDRVNILTKDDFTLLILCDGMGGHPGGALASSTTINTFDKCIKKNFPEGEAPLKDYVKWFGDTINLTRKEMVNATNGDEAMLDMGTTVTAALINPKRNIILVFNIGDSRTYALTTLGELKQISIDHNMLNKYIYEEHMDPVLAMRQKYQASLTSCLGPTKNTKIEVFNLENSYHNVFCLLVTSDGVHDFIEKPAMEMILKQNKTAEEIACDLVHTAMDNRSSDNCSAGIVILDNKGVWR